MTPAFLFPVCDDCGETLASPACGCGAHICAIPNSRSKSDVASASAASISSRQSRSIALSDFPFAIASPFRDPAIMKLADAA